MQDSRFASQKPTILSGLRLFKGQSKPPPPPPKDFPVSSSTISLPLSDTALPREFISNVSLRRSASPSSPPAGHQIPTLTTKKSLFKLPSLSRNKSVTTSSTNSSVDQVSEISVPEVSAPWNFQHHLHVDDGFVGLPPTWLSQAGLSAEDVEAIVSRRRQQMMLMPDRFRASNSTNIHPSNSYSPSLPPPLGHPLTPPSHGAAPSTEYSRPPRVESLQRKESVLDRNNSQASHGVGLLSTSFPTSYPPDPSLSIHSSSDTGSNGATISPTSSHSAIPVIADEAPPSIPRPSIFPPRLSIAKDRDSIDWSESLFSALPSTDGGFNIIPQRKPSLPSEQFSEQLAMSLSQAVTPPTVARSVSPQCNVNTGSSRSVSPPTASVPPLNFIHKPRSQLALLKSTPLTTSPQPQKQSSAVQEAKIIAGSASATLTTVSVTHNKLTSLPQEPTYRSESQASGSSPSSPSSHTSLLCHSPTGPSFRPTSPPTESYVGDTKFPRPPPSPLDLLFARRLLTEDIDPSVGRSLELSHGTSFDSQYSASTRHGRGGGLPNPSLKHMATESSSPTSLSYLIQYSPSGEPFQEYPRNHTENSSCVDNTISSLEDEDERPNLPPLIRSMPSSAFAPKTAKVYHVNDLEDDSAAGSILEEWLMDDSNHLRDYEPTGPLDENSFTSSAYQHPGLRIPQTPLGDALPESPLLTSPLPYPQQQGLQLMSGTNVPIRKVALQRFPIPPLLSVLSPPRVLAEHFKLLESYISPDDPRSLYSDLIEVAEGDSGSIYSARIRELDSGIPRSVAIKTVRVSKQGSPKVLSLQQELNLMREVGHEHVLSIDGLYLVDDTLWIKMELMERSLADLLELVQAGLVIDEIHLSRFAKDILLALAHLTVLNIAHRDVRSDNLLINRQGVLKLADFSNAVQLSPFDYTRSDIVGVIYWQAPEMRRGAYNASKVDVWSLGATVWEVVEVAPPFSNVEDERDLGDRLPELSHPDNCSYPLRDFLQHCSQPAPNRPTPEQLLQSRFIRSACLREDVVHLLSCARAIEAGPPAV